MSDISSDEYDGLVFNNRTTNATFQERLRQAQSASEQDPIKSSLRFDEIYSTNDSESLKKTLEELKSQVLRMESRVESMEKRLVLRREKRNREAGLTNLTPEERAANAVQEEKKHQKRKEKQKKLLEEKERKRRIQMSDDEEDAVMENESSNVNEAEESEESEEEEPDWDVVFEYMLLLGSDPSNDTNNLSGTDYLKPSADLRKKALIHEDVLQQTPYSSIKITAAKNTLENNPSEEGDIRHCDLFGTCYDQEFHILFDVLEPSMIMSNLEFEIDIEMQLDIGDILQKVKEDCNIMGFFRVLVHYYTLDKQRKDLFNKLTRKYEATPIHLELLSRSRIKLEGETDGIKLIFSWIMAPDQLEREKLDANIESHVQPVLKLEVVALPPVIEKDKDHMLDKVNDVFISMVKHQGVFKSVDYIVNKILL